MPWLASRTTAAVSSCTGTQMLMPVACRRTSTPCAAQRVDQRRARRRGVRRRARGRPCAAAAASVSRPSSIRCSSRLLQPWPSCRRATIGVAAARRGRRAPRGAGRGRATWRSCGCAPSARAASARGSSGRGRTMAAGRVVLDDEDVRGRASTAGELGARAGRQRRRRWGSAPRGWRKTAATGSASAAAQRARRSGPSSSIGTPTSSAPDGLEQVEQRREARGARPRRGRRSAASARTTRSSASMAPSTTVSSLGGVRPVVAQQRRAARAAPGRRGSCRACRPSCRPRAARAAGRAAGAGSGTPVDRSRREAGLRVAAPAGSGRGPAARRSAHGRAAPAVGRGSCPTARAAPRPRSPWSGDSASSRGRPCGSAAAGRPGAATPSRIGAG